MPAPAPPSVARLAAVAGLLHFGFDSLLRVWEPTTPPHLLTPYMGEAFRDMIGLLGRTPVSGITSFLNGVVSAIFAVALQEVEHRRFAKVAALLSGLWFLTGGLTFAVYLTAPGSLAVTSLLAGVPRALVVAWFLERSLPAPAQDQDQEPAPEPEPPPAP